LGEAAAAAAMRGGHWVGDGRPEKWDSM
jgi:hypothetical protein